MEDQKLIGVKEMASRLNVPVSWIYQRTMKGPKSIPHVKLGKYVRFNPEEVLGFFKSRV